MRFAFATFMVLSSLGGVAWGSVITRLSPAEVVARADAIVVGTVVSQRYIKDGPRLLTETSVTVEQNLRGASLWCVFPFQDWLALDSQLRHPDAAAERINVPANPRQYWRYRMHLTVEDLLRAEVFNQHVADLIADTGRR